MQERSLSHGFSSAISFVIGGTLLYPELLGPDFESLPRALRDFHSKPLGGRAVGTVTVHHTSTLLARLAGFPPAGENIPLALEVTASGNCEIWTRRFGSAVLQSTQRSAGSLLEETAGPVRVLLQVFADGSGMKFESRGARLWNIPAPLRVTAEARGDASSWTFEVRISPVGWYRGAVVILP